MDFTLTPFTLIPVGSLVTVVGVVVFFSKKFNTLQNVQDYNTETKKILADVVSNESFDKHVIEDAARHTSTMDKMANLQIAQAIENEQLIGIKLALVQIQADLKEVLRK